MGHIIFVVIHLVCALFISVWLLIVTIPLHLIYAAVKKKPDPNAPKPRTHVKCPDCKEFVHKEANVCHHCGCKLVPASEQVRPRQSISDRIMNGPEQPKAEKR